jgi:hypothetical protein
VLSEPCREDAEVTGESLSVTSLMPLNINLEDYFQPDDEIFKLWQVWLANR